VGFSHKVREAQSAKAFKGVLFVFFLSQRSREKFSIFKMVDFFGIIGGYGQGIRGLTSKESSHHHSYCHTFIHSPK
jgi:hypothetical protein